VQVKKIRSLKNWKKHKLKKSKKKQFKKSHKKVLKNPEKFPNKTENLVFAEVRLVDRPITAVVGLSSIRRLLSTTAASGPSRTTVRVGRLVLVVGDVVAPLAALFVAVVRLSKKNKLILIN
jgi:hypothetical protein